jgi:G:T/U mismatch-specific DNA glycosylase
MSEGKEGVQERIYSMPPVVGEEPWLLILGSMPGAESLRQQRYYAHPRNHFWPLMAGVFGEALPASYDDRLSMLRRHGVALWDSIGSCQRAGSLDAAIRAAAPNDIATLLREHPTIRAIACNGRKAQQEFCRHHVAPDEVEVLCLPSSSPIPRKGYLTIEDKRVDWQVLARFVR